MNILAMDTCFGACSVAVGKTVPPPAPLGTTAFETEFELRQTGHAEALIPMVERVMAKSEVKFDELERIAVTTGPGSFTGMRIGIAAARAMGVTLGIPVIGVQTLSVMAEAILKSRMLASGRVDHPILIAVDARQSQVYSQLFDKDLKAEPNVLSYLDAAKLAPDAKLIIAGSGALDVAACRESLGLPVSEVHENLHPNAHILCEMLFGLSIDQLADFPAIPLYFRPPDAKPQDGKSLARAS